jgi:hypothetical protein
MNDLKKLETIKLTSELRRRGYVVCVFQPADLDDRRSTEGWSDEKKADWLKENSRKIEDLLSERGNDAIDDLIHLGL